MRRLWLVTLSVALVPAALLAQRPAESLPQQTWKLDGVERSAVVAGPASAVPAKGSPLVFVFQKQKDPDCAQGACGSAE